MSNLLRLMKELGADAALSDEYEKDPEAVIQRFDLSAEERTALLDLDMEAIQRLTGLEEGGFYATHSTVKAYDT